MCVWVSGVRYSPRSKGFDHLAVFVLPDRLQVLLADIKGSFADIKGSFAWDTLGTIEGCCAESCCSVAETAQDRCAVD